MSITQSGLKYLTIAESGGLGSDPDPIKIPLHRKAGTFTAKPADTSASFLGMKYANKQLVEVAADSFGVSIDDIWAVLNKVYSGLDDNGKDVEIVTIAGEVFQFKN